MDEESTINGQFRKEMNDKIQEIDARIDNQGKWIGMRNSEIDHRFSSVEAIVNENNEKLQKELNEQKQVIILLSNRILDIQNGIDSTKPKKMERLTNTFIVSTPDGCEQRESGRK